MKKVVVFDFDGTIIYEDSLTVLFKREMLGIKRLVLPFYYFLKILSKMKLISVCREKELMYNILFKKNPDKLASAYDNVIYLLHTTPIAKIAKKYIEDRDRYVVYILSASAEEILRVFYCDRLVNIIGLKTRVNPFTHSISIIRHPYGEAKLTCLIEAGVTRIDEMYYDSPSDECLLRISKRSFQLKSGKIIPK